MEGVITADKGPCLMIVLFIKESLQETKTSQFTFYLSASWMP